MELHIDNPFLFFFSFFSLFLSFALVGGTPQPGIRKQAMVRLAQLYRNLWNRTWSDDDMKKLERAYGWIPTKILHLYFQTDIEIKYATCPTAIPLRCVRRFCSSSLTRRHTHTNAHATERTWTKWCRGSCCRATRA